MDALEADRINAVVEHVRETGRWVDSVEASYTITDIRDRGWGEWPSGSAQAYQRAFEAAVEQRLLQKKDGKFWLATEPVAKREAPKPTKEEQITSFTDAIKFHEERIREAQAAVSETKSAYEEAKLELRELEEARDGAKHGLYRFLCPKNGEFMPLFDTMEEADEDVHGKNATEWRTEPVASLRLSVNALKALTDNDIVVVGQLQDRVMAKPSNWWEELDGLSDSIAAAIVDKLNDFIFERTKR